MQENKKNTGRFEAFSEHILLFSIVTPVVILILYLLDSIIGTETSKLYINFFSYASIIFSGLFYSFILTIFVKEKIKGGFYIVFITFYIIFVIIFNFIFGVTSISIVLIPLLIAQFFVEAIVNEIFVSHDIFVEHWEGKTGKELETHLYHNNVEAGDLGKSLSKFQSVLIIISIVFFCLLFLFFQTKSKFSFLMIINLIIFITSIYFGYHKIIYFKNEAYYANIGFTQLIINKRKYLRLVLFIFLCAVTPAFLVSGNKALIKLKFNTNIEKVTDYNISYESNQQNFEELTLDKSNLEDMFGEYKENKIIEIIFHILKITLIGFMAVAVILFLFRPFFSVEWQQFWNEHKLNYYLKKFLEDIKDFIKFLFHKNAETFATVEAKTFKSSITDFLKTSKKSKEKKAELDRLTKQFMDIILWGSKQQVLYKKNMAPAEYTALLRNTLIQNNENYTQFVDPLNLIGELFEKALYDKNLLTKEEEKTYSDSVKKILEGII